MRSLPTPVADFFRLKNAQDDEALVSLFCEWPIKFVPVSGLVLVSGESIANWPVPASEALRRVYHFEYSAKWENQSGLRELAIIVLATAIGGGLTAVAAALRGFFG
jgi:hypothetical protein